MTWTSPFSLPGRWFKGNLHTHTTQSDGLLSPEQAIAWYREHGYDFISITDHWVLTPGEVIGRDFITITGSELHGPGYHLVALGIPALPDRDLADSPQALTDAIVSQGGLSFMAHPYWSGQTSADIAPVKSALGIEVFNAVCENARGLGYSRVHWDQLLAGGLRLTGLAVDDVHWKHGAQGQGFIMARAERLEEPLILEAIRQGHFYASTGPLIRNLAVVSLSGQPALQVHCSQCNHITFYATNHQGCRFSAKDGRLLENAVFPFAPDQIYLRVECQDQSGRIAWSNPVYYDQVAG